MQKRYRLYDGPRKASRNNLHSAKSLKDAHVWPSQGLFLLDLRSGLSHGEALLPYRAGIVVGS